MKKHDIFWGLLFILAAVLILLNQFGYFIGISMFDFVATVVLGVIILKSIVRLNFWGVFFPLAFLCILYADELNITKFTPWPALFTAFLLSIGFTILFKDKYDWGKHDWKDHDWGSHHNWANHDWSRHHHFGHQFNNNHNSFGSSVVNEKDDSVISCSSSFGECIKYVNSENFERANISCSFGASKVYFDNAQIPSGKAEIYVDVSFGEVVLYIPKTWKTICIANVFLGDMDKNNQFGAESPVVTIYGKVSFGNCKIFYV